MACVRVCSDVEYNSAISIGQWPASVQMVSVSFSLYQDGITLSYITLRLSTYYTPITTLTIE